MKESRDLKANRADNITQKIRDCLPFTFTPPAARANDEVSWVWRSKVSDLEATARFDAAHDMIVLNVSDTRSGKTISRWTSRVYMTGAWRTRLRRAAGESLILAQHRPRCPQCQCEMEVRERHSDHAQFFGCTSYPNCKGLVDIIDHDIQREKKEAAGINLQPVQQEGARAASR